ncbi:luciferin sulfotransferase-like [Ostrinia nubilalis]|uniref:luciferin sulfotransferase-like n=1 Tax=Ostrinia nubilalis TaxID=29057 RepID=UPI0030823304
MSTQDYPYEIKDLGPEETSEAFKYFNKHRRLEGAVRVGPKGYFLQGGFKKEAVPIYNLPLKADDVFVLSYPKSGTTWVQELVWLIGNNLDYEQAAAIPLVKRFPFLEYSIFFNSEAAEQMFSDIYKGDENKIKIVNEVMRKPGYKIVEGLPSPRFVKSHLPLSLLPPGLLRARVVYVARDPRDVAVSYYHHQSLTFYFRCGFTGDFTHFWDCFRKDMNLGIIISVDWTPYFEQVKEAWDKRDHPNMLFLFYEEILEVRRVMSIIKKSNELQTLTKIGIIYIPTYYTYFMSRTKSIKYKLIQYTSGFSLIVTQKANQHSVFENHLAPKPVTFSSFLQDLAGAVRRVAHFLGAPVSEEQVVRLCDHLSFHNFKNNKCVNFDIFKYLGLVKENAHFIRKGKAGGWREYFDEQMAAQAQQWIDDNLRGTDLRFPSVKK